jgi:peptide/nickel transport system ATP-binding protein
VQAQVLQLLHALQREHGFGMLFISHNLAVVEALCQRVAVMAGGEIVEVLEVAPGRGLTGMGEGAGQHPATPELLAAVPRLPAADGGAQGPGGGANGPGARCSLRATKGSP